MPVQVHPEYSYPIDDIKISNHWKECFNVNGRLWGFGYEAGAIQPILLGGAFISNGVVVNVTRQASPDVSDLVPPYFIYGHFPESSGGSVPVVGASRTLENGYAPLMLIHNDTTELCQALTLPLANTAPSTHVSDTTTHITSDQVAALLGANGPSLYNVFAKQSDTTSLLALMPDELKLLPYSLVAGYSARDVLSYDATGQTIYESMTSNSVNFVDIGIRELMDTTSLSGQRSNSGYMDALFSNVLLSAATSGYLHLSRCTTEQQTTTPGLKNNYSHKVKISNAQGSARLTWYNIDATTGAGEFDFGSGSNYIYTNIRVPSSTHLTYIEMSASDGTTVASTRKEYRQLSTVSPNVMFVDISDLVQSSMLYVDLKFEYDDGYESDYFYVDSIAKASSIDTIAMTDTTSVISSVRVASLVAQNSQTEYPIIDVSIDDGTTYLSNVIPDHYNDLSSLPVPSGTYKLKLRFNLINYGGDFSRVISEWPDNRSNQSMTSDSQADISVLIGGDENLIQKTSTLIFNRLSDTYTTGPSNTLLSLSEAASTTVGERIALVGGRINNIPQTNNYLINWGNNSIISNQQLSINASAGGLTSIGCSRLLNLNGRGNLGIDNFLEFIIPSDTWTTLLSSSTSGKTTTNNIDNLLYASSGTYGSSTGLNFNRSSLIWTAMSLEKMPYYSTCSLLKSRAIICQSDNGTDQIKSYFDHALQTEKSTQSPVTGAGNSGSSVYHDDTVSFGPWEKDGTYSKTHYLYVPYKSPRLSGFAVKYITE